MIKTIFALSILLSIVAILLFAVDLQEELTVLGHNNIEKQPLEIKLEKFICSDCGSRIASLSHSSQAITPDGKTYFFDDIGCLCLWLNRQKNKDKIVVWVYTEDTERYILAQDAWYSRVNITPIGYGFGAYEVRLYGQSDYYFNEVERFAIRGETLLHPMINTLLINNKI